MTKFLKFVDKIIRPLIWVSICLLFVELTMKSEDSLSGYRLFIWIERLTAVIFTAEYICRSIEDKTNPDGNIDIGHNLYNLSAMGIIDLFSILPFWLGFLPVLAPYLGMVRALRIIRAFKLFRYNRHLQLFALSIYRGLWLIKAAGTIAIIFILMASALLYEAEHKVQPEKFGDIWNIICWYLPVSLSTVGYGDMSPQTDLGKFVTICLVIIPGIAVVSTIFGVISSSFQEIMEIEKDPTRDIIQEFLKNDK